MEREYSKLEEKRPKGEKKLINHLRCLFLKLRNMILKTNQEKEKKS